MENKQLYNPKLKKEVMAPNWEDSEEEKNFKELEEIENELEEIESALYPKDTEPITLPEGENPEIYEKKLEKRHEFLVTRHKELSSKVKDFKII